jgi:excisionase family DNA binding protein
MARYVYEVELVPDGDGYSVKAPDFDAYITYGATETEALIEADDALKTYVAALLKFGDPVPNPVFGHQASEGGKVIALSFETDAGYIIEEVPASKAAEILGVSRSRVSHLIRDGVLQAQRVAGETRVSVDSLNAYKDSPRQPGRPRKTLAGAGA